MPKTTAIKTGPQLAAVPADNNANDQLNHGQNAPRVTRYSENSATKGEVSLVWAMKACTGHIGTRRRGVVNFTPRPLYPLERNPALLGPQSRSGLSEVKKIGYLNNLSLSLNKPRIKKTRQAMYV